MRISAVAGTLTTACVVLFIHGSGTKDKSATQGGPSSSAVVLLPQGVKALDLEAVRKALPKGWSMSNPEVVRAPLGYIGYGQDGVEIVFTGPRYVKPPKPMKCRAGNESFTLWVMPSDYNVRTSASLPQTNALLLGSSTEYKVFYLVATFRVPTWARWQDDLRAVLKLANGQS